MKFVFFLNFEKCQNIVENYGLKNSKKKEEEYE